MVDHYKVDLDKGEHRDLLLNCRAMIWNEVIYKSWHSALQKTFSPKVAVAVLFGMGKEFGAEVIIRAKEKEKNPFMILKIMQDHGTMGGWAKFTGGNIEFIDSGDPRSITIEAEDGFIPRTLGRTGRSECHLLRGFFVGAAEAFSGKRYECVENKCISKGDPSCEFLITLKKR